MLTTGTDTASLNNSDRIFELLRRYCINIVVVLCGGDAEPFENLVKATENSCLIEIDNPDFDFQLQGIYRSIISN